MCLCIVHYGGTEMTDWYIPYVIHHLRWMFFIPASATGTALLETPFPHIRRTFATKHVKIKSESTVFIFCLTYQKLEESKA